MNDDTCAIRSRIQKEKHIIEFDRRIENENKLISLNQDYFWPFGTKEKPFKEMIKSMRDSNGELIFLCYDCFREGKSLSDDNS